MHSADSPQTLVEILRSKALRHPDRLAYTFLVDGEREEKNLTYGELDRQARVIALRLQALGLEGQRVLLLYAPGLDYVAAFLGCLYAGAVAVPAYPPRNNQSLLRLQMIHADAQAAAALTTLSVMARAELLFDKAPALKALPWITTDTLENELAESWVSPQVDGSNLAFLQYTSGSTSIPKGVMVSHGNLLHNEQTIQEIFQQTEHSIIVGWLPFYHDMGLIGNVLQPLYAGASCVLMSPVSFLQRPFRWLQAISNYRGTTSGGPNFAYELCLKRITAEQRATLDLSSWRVAFNGAEPIRWDTLERFALAFAECGFTRESFYPCYGLAESTLIVSGKMNRALPPVKAFRATALENNRAVKCEATEADARLLVGCGVSLHDQRIIVNPETLTESLPGQVGEIWVKGSSVAQGYWDRLEETEHTFRAYLSDTGVGPFLRTGDLGFLHEDELFITGRAKDLIIIRGLNHYPQDIELTVARAHPALRPDSGAAFSIEVAGEECLVVVQEIEQRQSGERELEAVIDAIREAVADEHELQVYAVVLIKPRSIPKTSSGKIQRHACRDHFLAQTLEVVKSDIFEDVAPVLSQMSLTRESLLAAGEAERARLLESYVLEQTARVLRVNPARLRSRRSITALGLDSLALIELKNHIESELSVSLPLGSFLQDLSLRQLARQLLEQIDAPAPAPLVAQALAATPDVPALPSYNQESLWFLYQLARESVAYNIGGAAVVWGELDAAALRRAFQKLLDRHLPLRTTFATLEGRPVPRIEEHAELSFEVVDASAWDGVQLDQHLFEEIHRPFDLEYGPLLRVHLFVRSPLEHILLLTVHHIAVDLWSLVILLDELRVLYPSEKNGTEVSLPPLDFQYPDFAAWQSEMLRGAEGERLWEYWRTQLAGELPVLNLPTDYPRPAVQTYSGSSHGFKLNEELTRRLETLAREHGATLYSTLLTAFSTLLHRYTNQEDILVGCPTAGRSRVEFEGIVGNFVNTVVLRVNVTDDATTQELLGDVRRTIAAAIEHQHYPLPLLVERLQPTRDARHSPLFQVMFVLEKPHRLAEQGIAPFVLGETGAKMNLGELQLESIAIRQRVAATDLTLLMIKAGDMLSASLQYNTDLFSPDTIIRMAGHFQTLLEGIADNANRKLSELSLLTSSEEEQLLFEWNRTAIPLSSNLCLHELFEIQVEKTPEATALAFEGKTLSYEELNASANQLAHHLRQLGVGPEVLVGIVVERSVEMVIGLLGILKAGGAYVPLDPAYPKERLSFILADAQARFLLTQRHLSDGLPKHTGVTLFLDTDWPEIADHHDRNPPRAAQPDMLAYVIYTSGSTGKPKGVAISHSSLTNLLLSMAEQPGLTAADVLLSVTTLSFDIAGLELFLPLIAGAHLEVVSRDVAADGRRLAERMAASGVTVMQATPTTWRMLIAEGWQGDSHLKLLCGGEALTPDLAGQLLDRCGTLWNMYGPTESTIWSSISHVSSASEVITIGRPIANTQFYVLDAHLQVVPIGVTGELYIGGDGLARGYRNRAELTAQSFIPDALSGRAGARLYRTGDVARRLVSAEVECLGRVDYQVKVRGHRIELGEIESALGQHEEVREVAVIARKESNGETCLVAYVVAKDARETRGAKGQTSIDSLRNHLRGRLPDYMVPSAFVMLAAMPCTPNGKLDRKALPAPDRSRPDLAEGSVAPRTPVEEILVGIWSQVLGLEEVGVHDDFFQLGGHSLLASTVVSKLRHTLHVELPLRSFFETPTINQLALRIESDMSDRLKQDIVPLRRVSRDAPLPLSFAQQRLWFLHRLEPDIPFYNMPVAFRLYGQLNVPALEQCFNELIRRHEVLRTTFAELDGQAVQVVEPEMQLRIDLDDVRALTTLAAGLEVERLVRADARRPFNLETGPLVRVRIVRTGEEEYLVVLVVHHIVADGWSMGVMVREVAALYEAYAQGKESPLAELPIQYADFAHWQREWLQGDVLASQLDYWRKELAGAPAVLELPGDRPRPPVQTFHGARLHFSFSASLTEHLKEFSRAEGVTVFMSLLAGFNIVLSRYSGQTDILVGTTIANRNRAETEDLIGFFVNMVVMRTDLSGNPTVPELLRQVRDRALGAYTHQDLPFEKLVEELQLGRDLSRAALTPVVFTLQNAPLEDLRLEGLRMSMLKAESETAKFDVVLNMWEEQGEMKGWVEYNRDVFDEARIRQMVQHFENVMKEMLEKSTGNVEELEMLSAEEEAMLEQHIEIEELDTSFSF